MVKKLGLLWVSGLLLIVCCGTANAAQINDAAARGDMKALGAIVRANPSSVNSKDQYGRTPLFDACDHGRTAAVKFFIAHGANVNVGDDDIGTPLQRATNADIAKMLLAAGASVRSTGPTLGTPLYQAIVDDRRDVVRVLRARTPNLNIHEAAGWATPTESRNY